MNSEPLTQLLQKVEKHEEGIFEAMRKAQEKPPPNVSELVGDMDDLGVDQSDCGGSDCCRNEEGDKCCLKGQSDCCGHGENISKNSARIQSENLFVKDESLEQLIHSCMELMTEMGLPEELRRRIQQL